MLVFPASTLTQGTYYGTSISWPPMEECLYVTRLMERSCWDWRAGQFLRSRTKAQKAVSGSCLTSRQLRKSARNVDIGRRHEEDTKGKRGIKPCKKIVTRSSFHTEVEDATKVIMIIRSEKHMYKANALKVGDGGSKSEWINR